MNLYAHDLSLFDFANFSDNPIINQPSSISSSSNSLFTAQDGDDDNDSTNESKAPAAAPKSPPKHRHDGTSPLPLGMDWSIPPRNWEERETVWPHDPHTGWSYCVTVPSWIILPKLRGSDPIVFYRVQVGIQSPDGVTTIRGVLRRFSDFLNLLYELRKEFPKKKLPPAPPKKILRTKSVMLLEERRCSLEAWIEKLLSDIDISRSVQVATFLELEAAARSSFDEAYQSDVVSPFGGVVPSFLSQTRSDASLISGSLFAASDYDNDFPGEGSEVGTPGNVKENFTDAGMEASASEPSVTEQLETAMSSDIFSRNLVMENLQTFSRRKMHSGRESSVTHRDKVTENVSKGGYGMEIFPDVESWKIGGHVRRLSTESFGSDLSSVRASETSNRGVANLFADESLDPPEHAEASRTLDFHSSDLKFQSNSLAVFPSDEHNKLKRVLNNMKSRLLTAKTDMEDLMARLNQEVAVRQFLTTKVKDLEVDLETTRESCRENMQQAVLNERERFTQMQWDMEELRKHCLEMELKLKSEQEEKAHTESAKSLIIKENQMLLQELDVAKEQFENLQRYHEESEVKSKAEVKLLAKEVKSLRNSQSELKQELGREMKEKLELERVLQKEKQRTEHANNANAKLLHECEILRDRLQECSVNFLSEEEDKLIVDTSSPSDALDLLTTSDNRIGLLLAEAQLLAQDVENSVASLDKVHDTNGGDQQIGDGLRKMLTDTFVDNARLRKQINSVIRCALNVYVKSEMEDEEEETPLKKTVLRKFLER